MTGLINIAATAILVAATAIPVAATTITYSQGVSIPTLPDWTASLSLHQFDPSLGTLTGVRVTVAATIIGEDFFENLSPTSELLVSGNGRALVNLSGLPNGGSAFARPTWSNGYQLLAVFDGVQDFAGADSAYLPGIAGDFGFQDLSDFSGYSGLGFLDATLAVVNDGPRYGFGEYRYGDTHIRYFFSDLVTAAGSITYTYDPIVSPPTGGVPEPASWAMLIAGFAMIGAAQRRRSRALPA